MPAKKPLQKPHDNKPLQKPNVPAKKPKPLQKLHGNKPLLTPHTTKPSTRFCLR